MNTNQAKNWNDLNGIVDVATLTGQDEQCLQDIQRVIESHGLTQKFGVALLHKHFDIGENEVLLENTEKENRRLVTKPVPVSEVDSSSVITTVWRFDHGFRYGCSYCKKNHCQS